VASREKVETEPRRARLDVWGYLQVTRGDFEMARFEGTVAEHTADVFEFNFAGPMGVERATDVVPGGEREHGLFGQEQSAFVAVLNDAAADPVVNGPHYGQWLQDEFFGI
jgi:hypothetical protein